MIAAVVGLLVAVAAVYLAVRNPTAPSGQAAHVLTPPLRLCWTGNSQRPELHVQDTNGARVWAPIVFEDGPVTLPQDLSRPAPPLAHFGDDDGRSLAAVATAPPGRSGTIHFLDLEGKHEVNTFTCDAPFPHGYEQSVWKSTWQKTFRRRTEGPDAILAGWFRDGAYAATVVDWISSDAELVGRMFHSGQLFAWEQGDLDRDGLDEMLLYGFAHYEERLIDYPSDFAVSNVHPLVVYCLKNPCYGQIYPTDAWDVPQVRLSGHVIIPPYVRDGKVEEPRLDDISWGVGRISLQLSSGVIVNVGQRLEPESASVPDWFDGPLRLWWDDGESIGPVVVAAVGRSMD